MSLAEEDLAFEGLEETLEEFRVMDAQYATEWSWSHLRDLHKMEMIDIDMVSLGSISEPLPKLISLTAFAISSGDVSFIVEDAFQGLENIRLMVLKRNEISELSRSMFPDPATHLRILDLRYVLKVLYYKLRIFSFLFYVINNLMLAEISS